MYYLSWLRNKILHNDPDVEKKQGWTTVGDMEGCGHYRVGEEVTAGRPRGGLGGMAGRRGQALSDRPAGPSPALPAVKYERIKFLVIALKSSVEVYAWAPKPYHKFMAFKVALPQLPTCPAPPQRPGCGP